MADYWKSQPRKFCDFCKCWITDNKPSIEFHERGKRHQENVRKRIDEVKQKSAEKAQKDAEQEDDFRKMEEAALAAFKKDLQENPALAAQYGVKVKSKTEEEPKKSSGPAAEADSSTPSTPPKKEWYEAVSDEGYTYYWNITTGQSVWEKPESYVGLAEQQQQEGDATKGETTAEQPATTEAKPASTEVKAASTEGQGATLGKRKRHMPAVEKEDRESESSKDGEEEEEEEKEEEEKKPAMRADPQSYRSAYGKWETVSTTPAPMVDLQLPIEEVPVEDIPLPAVVTEEKERKKDRFKEKTVTSLGGSGEKVAFKKRKVAAGARNVRQRGDDD